MKHLRFLPHQEVDDGREEEASAGPASVQHEAGDQGAGEAAHRLEGEDGGRAADVLLHPGIQQYCPEIPLVSLPAPGPSARAAWGPAPSPPSPHTGRSPTANTSEH